MIVFSTFSFFFFFNDTATTEIYTLPTRRSSDLARFRGKYEPITSTMSLAAAICSIVSGGIEPIGESIFRSFGSGSDAKIYPVTSCFQTMRLKLSISGRLIDSKFTMHLADSLILAFSPHGRRDSLSCWERVRVRAVMVTAAILLV